jgi:hypothetical protein
MSDDSPFRCFPATMRPKLSWGRLISPNVILGAHTYAVRVFEQRCAGEHAFACRAIGRGQSDSCSQGHALSALSGRLLSRPCTDRCSHSD